MSSKTIIIILLGVGIPIFLSSVFQSTQESQIFDETVEDEPVLSSLQNMTIFQNLHIPWEMVFFDDSHVLITERSGTLAFGDMSTQSYKRIAVPNVEVGGEGGLLGLALHPDFVKNQLLYIYRTTKKKNTVVNQVVQYTWQDEDIIDERVIIDDIPGATYHNGGRIKFGPDGYLYVTTGDAQKPDLAQDTDSLAGKILRVSDTGTIPDDNPFKNEVYSYGHRNPQGLTWDNEGNLWSTEHGRSFPLSGLDEINVIRKGENYGWPESQGDEVRGGTIAPVLHSGASTWAPGGMVFSDQKILFTGLKGESLYALTVATAPGTSLETFFSNQFGRIRNIVMSPTGSLYIMTSNTDGRGGVDAGENDKVVQISF